MRMPDTFEVVLIILAFVSFVALGTAVVLGVLKVVGVL